MTEELDLHNYVTNVIKKGKINKQEDTFFTPYYDDRLPKELNGIYEKLDSCLNELILGRWHILSSLDARIRNETLQRHGETTIYNFASVYTGLGWELTASIDLENSMVFLHRSGGSNGYDVQDNLNKLLNYRKNANKFISKLIPFTEFIQLCINEEKSDFKLLIPTTYYIH